MLPPVGMDPKGRHFVGPLIKNDHQQRDPVKGPQYHGPMRDPHKRGPVRIPSPYAPAGLVGDPQESDPVELGNTMTGQFIALFLVAVFMTFKK